MTEQTLENRIKDIATVFDIKALLNRKASSKRQIAKYYRLNRIAYKFVNSKDGFVHMGISRDGIFKEKDFLEHAMIISSYIESHNVHNILELAAGQAATTKYLAKKFPSKSFVGLDLPNGQLNTTSALKNLSLQQGDYHDLSAYGDNSFDLIYIIEALCHAASKEKVIQEVKRILKPGGHFIVFDGYSSKPHSEMSDLEAKASNLTYLTMMVNPSNHYYGDFTTALTKNNLKVVQEENLSDYVLPSMKRLEAKSVKFFKHPTIARVVNRIIPNEITANAVAAYLMPVTVSSGLHQYWLTVARKS